MNRHVDLGNCRFTRSRKLKTLIEQNENVFAGNSKLKIFGTLNCKSGKRMKMQNRVFFSNEIEALVLGFRPCCNCMRLAYKVWRANQ